MNHQQQGGAIIALGVSQWTLLLLALVGVVGPSFPSDSTYWIIYWVIIALNGTVFVQLGYSMYREQLRYTSVSSLDQLIMYDAYTVISLLFVLILFSVL